MRCGEADAGCCVPCFSIREGSALGVLRVRHQDDAQDPTLGFFDKIGSLRFLRRDEEEVFCCPFPNKVFQGALNHDVPAAIAFK